MEDKGYSKARYTTNKEGEKLAWKATLTNKSGEQLIWEGKEDKGKIEGTIISKPSGTTWIFKNEH